MYNPGDLSPLQPLSAMEEIFIQWWKENRVHLLKENPEYQRVLNDYKLKSGSDWLLFALPIVAGTGSFQYLHFRQEFLNYLVASLIAIVCFFLCAWIKALTNGNPSLADIEERLRQQHYEHWKRTGKFPTA